MKIKNFPRFSQRPLAAKLGVLATFVLLIAGCVVNSIYPFYTAKDLTFDPALLGTWSDPEETNASKETWTFEKIAPQTYKLTTCNSGETNEFDTHLFTLGGQKFLDSLPRARAAYHAPEHFLLRVRKFTPTLELELLDYGWLADYLEHNPKALRHIIVPPEIGDSQEKGALTLTAETAELQKFLRKHLANTNAWGELIVMKKQ
jgi:hypothetical protein